MIFKKKYKNMTDTGSFSSYMTKMFTKVSVGLLVTFFTTLSIISFFPIKVAALIGQNIGIRLLLIVLEISAIIFINKKVQKRSLKGINFLFYGFCLLNGVGLTYIFFFYKLNQILFGAFSATVFFLSMSLYGHFTKKDISSWGSIIRSMFLGVFIISIVQLFMYFIFNHSTNFISFLISLVMIVALSLSTAYEIQSYKEFFLKNEKNTEDKEALATLGALSLVLNYILLFKHLLRLIGYIDSRKKD